MVVSDYNANMRGVDIADQHMAGNGILCLWVEYNEVLEKNNMASTQPSYPQLPHNL